MLKDLLIIPIILFFPCLLFSQLPNWVEQTSGTTQTLTSAHTNSTIPGPSYVWVCGYAGTVLRSTNDGTSWQSVGINGIPSATQLINIVGLDANTAVTAGYVGANTFVYRTSNAGANWTQVFTETNGFIDAIVFKSGSTTQGFMMGDPVGTRWSLWKTSNGGANWDSAGLYLPVTGTEAGWNNSMWTYGNNIWFGTNNTKLYYSTNFGANWTAQATTGSLNSYAVWFYSLTGGSEGLFGGSDMYRTSNYGANWTLQTTSGTGNFGGITGGPNIIVDAVNFIYTFYVRGTSVIYASTSNGANWFTHYTAAAGTYRYIGTNFHGNKFWGVRSNGGISYLEIPLGGVNTISSEMPDKFSLHQNFPNPFNPVTKIQFSIPKRSNVRLDVYNNLGQELKILLNEEIAAGTYETEFDGSTLSSGMYFYKLTAGKYSEVKSMILLK